MKEIDQLFWYDISVQNACLPVFTFAFIHIPFVSDDVTDENTDCIDQRHWGRDTGGLGDHYKAQQPRMWKRLIGCKKDIFSAKCLCTCILHFFDYPSLSQSFLLYLFQLLMIDILIDWLIDQLIDWSINWLTNYLMFEWWYSWKRNNCYNSPGISQTLQPQFLLSFVLPAQTMKEVILKSGEVLKPEVTLISLSFPFYFKTPRKKIFIRNKGELKLFLFQEYRSYLHINWMFEHWLGKGGKVCLTNLHT